MNGVAALLSGLVVLAALLYAGYFWVGLPAIAAGQGFALYLVIGLLVFAAMPPSLWENFGLANGITLCRAVFVAFLAAFIGNLADQDRLAWMLAAVAFLAFALDGLDGAVARRSGTCSPFGARFDMEVDALLILIVSLLLFASGKLGAWVLLIGGMRYGFIAAGVLWRPLRAPLPPKARRRYICGLQVVALAICLAPPMGPVPATLVAGGALAALSLSFLIDIVWLMRVDDNLVTKEA